MADYMIVNSTNVESTNVNAGAVKVPARSVGNTITLTDAELAAVLLRPGFAVLPDVASREHMRGCAKVLQYRRVATL